MLVGYVVIITNSVLCALSIIPYPALILTNKLLPDGSFIDNNLNPLHSDSGACTNYSLMHSASALSGFTCTSSPTMNEKFQVRVHC